MNTFEAEIIEVGPSRVTLARGTGLLTLEVDGDDAYRIGQSVVVQTDDINGQPQFFISDTVRRPILLVLLCVFVLAILAFGGKAALRSLLGMVASFVLLFAVFLPAILAGVPPLLVAVGGGLCVMALTLTLSHGWRPKTWAALLGITGSLALTAALSLLAASLAAMTGMNEEILFLLTDYPDLNTRGILLAGIVIGTLGVLDDVTISQASAVFELRAANPRLTAVQLFRSAMRIGQDHVASAVNTLILAYAGSALPLLLLLTGVSAGESWWTLLNREVIATEILRALVGSIGLLAAVPVTTWVASVLASRHARDHLFQDDRAE